MWGECSRQYAACRQVAEAYLQACDAGPGGGLEEVMEGMVRLGVGGGDGDGDVGAGRGA